MKAFVLTACGISLLQNIIPGEQRSRLNALANRRTHELSPEERGLFETWQDAAAQRLKECEHSEAKKLSAELNGLLTWLEENKPGVHDHLLLVTDTHAGTVVGRLLQQWMRVRGMSVDVRKITDLATRDLEEFQTALSDLAKTLSDEMPGWRAADYRVIFNLTGGFKSIIGFLQTLGMALADECLYIFETGDQLLRVPRLPVRFAPEESIADHLSTIRRLARGYRLPEEDCEHLPETLLFRSGNEITLSAWGEALWAQLQERMYENALLPPLSCNIRYSDRFVRQASALDPSLRVQLNRRIDQLSQLLDKCPGGANLGGLNFHPLQGDPKPPSTHEFYVTSGGGARRAFGHYEGNTFVIDSISGHL